MSETIGREEFEQRLIAVCLGGGSGMPRRHRDQHILLASATLWMEIGAVYTEPEVNSTLRAWLHTVGAALRLDEVTLRRELVDRSYVLRDDAGRNYSLGPGPADVRFASGVGSINPIDVLTTARAEREKRKRAFVDK